MAGSKRKNDSERKVEAKRRFNVLINSRRSESLSENSALALQDAVFQLIAHHQDVDGLLAECDDHSRDETDHEENGAAPDSMGGKPSSQKGASSMTVFSLTRLIRDRARILRSPVAVVAANICAGKLTEMVGRGRVCETEQRTAKPPKGLSSADKNRCVIIVGTAEEFVRMDSFNQLHFTKLVCKEDYLPLSVVWQLHISGVMPLDKFILQKQKDNKFVRCFCEQLRGSNEGNEEEESSIIKEIFSFLVWKGFSENHAGSSDMKQISVSILEHWLSDFVDSVTNPIAETPEIETPASLQIESSVVNHLMSSKHVDQATLKRFSAHSIYHLVKHRPDLKVSEAIQNQHLWTYVKSPQRLTSLIKELFLLMTSEEVGSLLSAALQKQQQGLGWRCTLTLASTFLLCYPEASNIVKDLLRELLGKAMENCETSLLTTGFLLARQACLEGPHTFPSYRDWFSSTFGDSSKSVANNRKSFMFMMKFLSDIVPFETSQHLKVHILKPPFVPSKCREVLSEYLMLARTRLADLKDPIDSGGVGDTAEPGTSSDKAQKLETDIEKALVVFDSSGKIPSSIIEASIFRKPYYLGRFLPGLLKPRPLPDIPDSRMKLIEELKRAEKIPSSMYTSYVKACEREKSQLLEGLYIDDDSMEDALLQPMDQLRYRLSQLLESPGQTKGERTQAGWKDVLSHVSEKLELVLANQDKGAGKIAETCPVLCLNSPQLTHINLQVVDALMNTICRMVFQDGTPPSVLAGSLLAFVKMLSQYPAIYPDLVVRMCKLITEQGPGLEAHHIFGITAILICLGSTSSLWPPIRVHDTKMSASDLVQYLIGQLYHHTSQWMRFSLSLCTSYLQQSFCMFPSSSVVAGSDACAFVPKSLIQKFTYLSCRLIPDINAECWDSGGTSPARLEGDDPQQLSADITRSIFRSKVFQDMLTHCQLSFGDWIGLELAVVPGSDCLSETDRYNYYLHMTHDVYIPGDVSEGGCGQSYAEACSQLLAGILQI